MRLGVLLRESLLRHLHLPLQSQEAFLPDAATVRGIRVRVQVSGSGFGFGFRFRVREVGAVLPEDQELPPDVFPQLAECSPGRGNLLL